jgi:uncharacterized membrane protein required for colicin V production
MLDVVILLLLLFGFFIGFRRGFILQTIHMVGFFVSFIVAYLYYDDLASILKLWVPYPVMATDGPLQMLFANDHLETAYYRAIAFAIIFFVFKILLQIIGSMLDFLAHLPILKQANIWAGGMLGLLEVYFILFIVLYIVALVPIESIQATLQQSVLAEAMIKHTPFISSMVKQWWLEYVTIR